MILKCDFLIEDIIVFELKSVSTILDVHKFQVLNCMNLLKSTKGILVNFNVKKSLSSWAKKHLLINITTN